MRTFINIMLGIVGVALVAAVYLMLRTTGGDDEEAPAAEPDRIVHMSTSGVVDNIERRLEKRTGRQLVVRCPKRVDSAVGTRFRCSVRYRGGEERIALATVVIDGPDGDFTWTSSSDELRTPGPTPTPTA